MKKINSKTKKILIAIVILLILILIFNGKAIVSNIAIATKNIMTYSTNPDEELEKTLPDEEETKETGEATFSFETKTITLNSKYKDEVPAWKYSIEGGEEDTWVDVTELSVELNEDEIEKINADNNIQVKIGENATYIIDIEVSELPKNLYANDLENKIIGATSDMEWKIAPSEVWTSYETEPDLTGTKNITVRMKTRGTYLSGAEKSFSFTSSTETPQKKYISMSKLSAFSVSSEDTENGKVKENAIDGNANTYWSTLLSEENTEKYYIIKLDTPKYISQVEYVPAQNEILDGNIKSAQIDISMDGQHWKPKVISTNWDSTSKEAKRIQIAIAILEKAQYIRIIGKETEGNLMSIAMINLYENTTIVEPSPSTSPSASPSISPNPSPSVPPIIFPTPSPIIYPTPTIPIITPTPVPTPVPTPSLEPTPIVEEPTPEPTIEETGVGEQPYTPETTPVPTVNPTTIPNKGPVKILLTTTPEPTPELTPTPVPTTQTNTTTNKDNNTTTSTTRQSAESQTAKAGQKTNNQAKGNGGVYVLLSVVVAGGIIYLVAFRKKP